MTEAQCMLYQQSVDSVRAELQTRSAVAAAEAKPKAVGRAAKEAAALESGRGAVAVERAVGATRLKALFTYLRKVRSQSAGLGRSLL